MLQLLVDVHWDNVIRADLLIKLVLFSRAVVLVSALILPAASDERSMIH